MSEQPIDLNNPFQKFEFKQFNTICHQPSINQTWDKGFNFYSPNLFIPSEQNKMISKHEYLIDTLHSRIDSLESQLEELRNLNSDLIKELQNRKQFENPLQYKVYRLHSIDNSDHNSK
jgi:hypothetical protein